MRRSCSGASRASGSASVDGSTCRRRRRRRRRRRAAPNNHHPLIAGGGAGRGERGGGSEAGMRRGMGRGMGRGLGRGMGRGDLDFAAVDGGDEDDGLRLAHDPRGEAAHGAHRLACRRHRISRVRLRHCRRRLRVARVGAVGNPCAAPFHRRRSLRDRARRVARSWGPALILEMTLTPAVICLSPSPPLMVPRFQQLESAQVLEIGMTAHISPICTGATLMMNFPCAPDVPMGRSS